MTNHDNPTTTDEMVTIVPEVAVSTSYIRDTKAAADALEALMPRIYEAFDLVGPVLAEHFRVWETGYYVDGIGERFDKVTGWDRLNLLLIDFGALGAIYDEDVNAAQPFEGRETPEWYRAFRSMTLRHDLAKLDAIQERDGELSQQHRNRRLDVLSELAGAGTRWPTPSCAGCSARSTPCPQMWTSSRAGSYGDRPSSRSGTFPSLRALWQPGRVGAIMRNSDRRARGRGGRRLAGAVATGCVLLVVLSAGCSSDGGGAVTTTTTVATTTTADPEPLIRQYASVVARHRGEIHGSGCSPIFDCAIEDATAILAMQQGMAEVPGEVPDEIVSLVEEFERLVVDNTETMRALGSCGAEAATGRSCTAEALAVSRFADEVIRVLAAWEPYL